MFINVALAVYYGVLLHNKLRPSVGPVFVILCTAAVSQDLCCCSCRRLLFTGRMLPAV